jgi:hypothetical protein
MNLTLLKTVFLTSAIEKLQSLKMQSVKLMSEREAAEKSHPKNRQFS